MPVAARLFGRPSLRARLAAWWRRNIIGTGWQDGAGYHDGIEAVDPRAFDLWQEIWRGLPSDPCDDSSDWVRAQHGDVNWPAAAARSSGKFGEITG